MSHELPFTLVLVADLALELLLERQAYNLKKKAEKESSRGRIRAALESKRSLGRTLSLISLVNCQCHES